MSTKAKLNKLLKTKEDIKKAIQNKGGNVGDVFDEYPAAIKNLKAGFFTVPAWTKFAYSNISEFPEDWDWSEFENLEDCSNIFYHIPLTKLPNIKLKKVKNLSYAFAYNKVPIIDTTGWDTSNLTNLNYTFSETSIVEVPKMDTSNVTNFENTFDKCTGLSKVDELDTSNATGIQSMFSGCTNLTDLCEINVSKYTSDYGSQYNSPLKGCSALRHFGGFKGLSRKLYLTDTTSLDYQSLLNVLNGLASGVSGKTLYLHQDLVNQLSDDDIAIATNKGWSISPSKTITEPVVVTALSQIPSSTAQITPRTYDFSQFTGKLGSGTSSLPSRKSTTVFEADLSSTVDASDAFCGDSNKFKYVILTNTSNITNMSDMFNYCVSLKDIYVEDTSNVTNMSGMFAMLENVNVNFSDWDVSNVTNMSSMFSYTNISDNALANWDVSKVENMASMFEGAKRIIGISNWDVSNVTNMSFMFARAKISNIDVSKWDVSNVTNMDSMFWNTKGAETLDLSTWTPGVGGTVDMQYMFKASDVKHIILGDTSNVTSLYYAFEDNPNLESITILGNLSKITNFNQIFGTGIKSGGTFYYNPQYDYSQFIKYLPSTWTAVPLTM